MEPKAEFLALLRPVLDSIAGRAVDAELEADLSRDHPVGGETWRAIAAACESGIRDGWMGLEGDERRKGGRVIEPGPETHDMSVDVVEIRDIAGPHHRHPKGEICAVLPVSAGARFDGHGEGWAVYPAGSDHVPTGENGRVRILFLLPGGAIEYTNATAGLGSGSG